MDLNMHEFETCVLFVSVLIVAVFLQVGCLCISRPPCSSADLLRVVAAGRKQQLAQGSCAGVVLPGTFWGILQSFRRRFDEGGNESSIPDESSIPSPR